MIQGQLPDEVVQPELDLGRVGVDYSWFHLMKSRLVKGLVKEVGAPAVCVYLLIKAHANHNTGRSYPSQDLLAGQTGWTTETIRQAVKKLVAAGLLTTIKCGRHLEYQLIEQAPMKDQISGASVGGAEFAYVPKEFSGQLASLKNFLAEGVPLNSGITLNLTVNLIQQRDNGTVKINNITITPDADSRLDHQLFSEKLRALNF